MDVPVNRWLCVLGELRGSPGLFASGSPSTVDTSIGYQARHGCRAGRVARGADIAPPSQPFLIKINAEPDRIGPNWRTRPVRYRHVWFPYVLGLQTLIIE
jgi:hypothetical protein